MRPIGHVTDGLVGWRSSERYSDRAIKADFVAGAVAQRDVHRPIVLALQVNQASTEWILRFWQGGPRKFAPLFIDEVQRIWMQRQDHVAVVFDERQRFSVECVGPQMA